MKTKKVTYVLPIDVVNQISKLKELTGKSKSRIISDLVKETMTEEDKILSENIANTLPQVDLEKTSLKDLAGTIDFNEETDAVKLKNSIYLKKAGF
ncbi:MAG: hypothetical protein ACRC1M_06135 [Methanobacteriaceae archaeon]